MVTDHMARLNIKSEWGRGKGLQSRIVRYKRVPPLQLECGVAIIFHALQIPEADESYKSKDFFAFGHMFPVAVTRSVFSQCSDLIYS
jgi:hypothetical protein